MRTSSSSACFALQMLLKEPFWAGRYVVITQRRQSLESANSDVIVEPAGLAGPARWHTLTECHCKYLAWDRKMLGKRHFSRVEPDALQQGESCTPLLPCMSWPDHGMPLARNLKPDRP